MAKFSSVFADCLVLAEFYLIMPKLGVLFERLIHGQWQFGADVIKESGFYLGIAEIFRSQRILEEAMRHHIGRGELRKNSSKLSVQMEILAWQKSTELFQFLTQLNQDLANVEPELRHPLFEDESPEQPPRRQAIMLLARTVFVEWLYGKMPAPADTMTPTGGHFYRKLLQYQNLESIDFMGSSVGRGLCEDLDSRHPGSKEVIGGLLCKYARRASRLIGEAIYSKSMPAARYQASGDAYFTNMPFAKEDLPWNRIIRSENSLIDGFDESVGLESPEPASTAWLAKLGLSSLIV